MAKMKPRFKAAESFPFGANARKRGKKPKAGKRRGGKSSNAWKSYTSGR